MNVLFDETADDFDPDYKLYFSRRDQDKHVTEAIDFMETLWDQYKPYADTNFLENFKYEFLSRFWEMYLGHILLSGHHKLLRRTEWPTKKNFGPDICIDDNKRRIWIEAVAPRSGDPCNPNSVPPFPTNTPTTMRPPEEQIILRLTNSIDDKFKKLSKYQQSGLIGRDDVYVIALNCHYAYNRHPELVDIPFFIKAVFPIGQLQYRFTVGDFEHGKTEYLHRDFVPKANQEKIPTNIFLDPRFAAIAGVLFSRVDPVNLGHKIHMVHNPLAINILPQGYLQFAVEYWAEIQGDIYELKSSGGNL